MGETLLVCEEKNNRAGGLKQDFFFIKMVEHWHVNMMMGGLVERKVGGCRRGLMSGAGAWESGSPEQGCMLV